MAEPTERDQELARQVLSGSLSPGNLRLNIMLAIAQAREEGRRVGLQDAKAACREGVAGEDAKAMAWLLDWGVGFKGLEVTLDADRAQRWECVGNCTVTALYPDLPAAQALLARLEALHKVAADQVTDPSWPEREQEALKWLYNTNETGKVGAIPETILAMLQARATEEARLATLLARWQPIVRAAVKWRRPPLHWCGLFADQQLMDAVDALSPEERAEILEGGE